VELQSLAARCGELSIAYWRAADAGLPTRQLFEQLTAQGRQTLAALRQHGNPSSVTVGESGIAGMLLDAYGREPTTCQEGSRTHRRMREHWSAAEEFTPLVGPDKLRHYLAGRAQYELGEGRASEALALVDRADPPRHDDASPATAPATPHGDLRALRAEALHQLYDSRTALEVLAPLEAGLRTLLPDGPIPDSASEAQRRIEAEFARGGAPADVARLLEASTVYHRVLDTKAGALRDTGRPEEAERAYVMLMPQYTASGLEAVGHLQLARCALDRAAVEEACRRLDRVAPLFESAYERDMASVRAHLRRVRGATYCAMRAETARLSRRHQEALDWCDRGTEFLTARPDASAAATLHTEQARSHQALGDQAGAARYYRLTVTDLDRVLRVSLGHRFDTLHLRFRRPLFEEVLGFAEQSGDAGLAAVVTDLLKARAFSARLSLNRSGAPNGQEARAVEDRTAFADLTGDIAQAERQGRSEDAGHLRGKRAELLIRIRAVDPRWHLIRDDPPFDPDRLTHFLAQYPTGAPGSRPGRCVALSLYERPEGLLTLLATPDGRLRSETCRPTEATRRALDAYHREIDSGHPPDPARLDFWGLQGVGLADLVPAAVADEIADSGTCLLSPHGRLHALPWTVVRHRGRHLVRDTALGVVPNLSCVPLLDHRPDGPIEATLVGVTELADGSALFPQVGRAVRILSKALGPDSLLGEPVTGPAATVAALRGLLESGPPRPGRTAVLQVATHGVRSPGTPFETGVQLADGDLETGEVLMGRMRHEEVVLTACSTSFRTRADHSGGHGALAGPAPREPEPLELAGDVANSLVHAFHEAGAAFVLASPVPVWPRLAIHHSFQWFAHRAAGCAPLEAARRAAVALLDNDDSPRQTGNWAGITAYGAR
jgi:tetratricopeptide (TPR) repeat protein